MEIKRTISRIIYRIEPKPEGGFIARCDDASVPPLEAATRVELEQQIRNKITSEVESQIPGLKISLEKQFISPHAKFDGGFAARPGDVSPQSSAGGPTNAVENWLVNKAVALVEKNLPSELVEQVKHQQVDGKIKIAVTVSGKDKVQRNYVVSNGSDLISRVLQRPSKTSGALEPSNPVSASFSGTNLDNNSPITPSSSSSFLGFLAAAVILIGMFFFFLYLKK